MRAALDALVRADPRLAPIEAAAGPLPWRVRPGGFPGLLRIIMGQQISSAAAAAIWGRLTALPGAGDPAGLLLLPDDALRGAGLSRPKVTHARGLAEAFLDGRLSADGLAAMDDAAAVLLGLPKRPGPVALRGLAEAWRPHRALAARLLWHHWRWLTGRPSVDELPG